MAKRGLKPSQKIPKKISGKVPKISKKKTLTREAKVADMAAEDLEDLDVEADGVETETISLSEVRAEELLHDDESTLDEGAVADDENFELEGDELGPEPEGEKLEDENLSDLDDAEDDGESEDLAHPDLEKDMVAEDEASELDDEPLIEESEPEEAPALEVSGKILSRCQHCNAEYYLLQELVGREARCCMCLKIFNIEFAEIPPFQVESAEATADSAPEEAVAEDLNEENNATLALDEENLDDSAENSQGFNALHDEEEAPEEGSSILEAVDDTEMQLETLEEQHLDIGADSHSKMLKEDPGMDHKIEKDDAPELELVALDPMEMDWDEDEPALEEETTETPDVVQAEPSSDDDDDFDMDLDLDEESAEAEPPARAPKGLATAEQDNDDDDINMIFEDDDTEDELDDPKNLEADGEEDDLMEFDDLDFDLDSEAPKKS